MTRFRKSQLFLAILTYHTIGTHSHDIQNQRELNIHAFSAAGKDWNNFLDWSLSHEFESTNARCHTPTPSSSDVETNDKIFKKWIENHPCTETWHRNPLCINAHRRPTEVNTYFHIMRRDDGSGSLTDDQIDSSIHTLNQAFKPFFMFKHHPPNGVNFVDNSDWYHATADSDDDMKRALRKNEKCSDLHIYALEPAEGVLGWATFPDACSGSPAQDGVVIHSGSVPGGYAAPYDQGHNLIHQVGHWLGLYHTFQGGCDEDESIPSTPAEKEPAYKCEARDTCTFVGENHPEEDPIHNYMDYTDDACTNEFTDEQFARMMAMWDHYRDPTAVVALEDDECDGFLVEMDLVTEETDDTARWELTNDVGKVVDAGGPYPGENYITHDMCMSVGLYKFVMHDSGENGLGEGHYKLRVEGKIVHEGGDFTDSEEWLFRLPIDDGTQQTMAGAAPTCQSLKVMVKSDNHGEQTRWSLTDGIESVVARGGPYPNNYLVTHNKCLNPGRYNFVIEDSGGDGICCNNGEGEVELILDGQVIYNGAEFGDRDTFSFEVDGVKQ